MKQLRKSIDTNNKKKKPKTLNWKISKYDS